MRDTFRLLVGLLPVLSLLILAESCSTLTTVTRVFSTTGNTVAISAGQTTVGTTTEDNVTSIDYLEARNRNRHNAIDPWSQAESDNESTPTRKQVEVCPGQPGLDRTEAELDLAGEEGLSDDVTPEDNAITDFVQAQHDVSAHPTRSEENTSVNRENLMKEIINMLGVQYRYGGTNALAGIDCSAFVRSIFSRAVGMRLPRTSVAQYSIGKKVKKDDLLIGDLVFFKTRRRRAAVSHVGIYVGENLFAHASRKQGVMVSSLESRYYTKTYVGAKRLVTETSTGLTER